jgi:hypothetical protein
VKNHLNPLPGGDTALISQQVDRPL